jgi:dihydrolipoyl dehydrogenase
MLERPRPSAVDAEEDGCDANAFPPITPLRPPDGAPNVLVVLIDDVGFGASSAFGGPCHFDRLGIEHTPKGIGVDDSLRTSVANIWAIGDATGKSILAHVGMQQGLVCAENIAAGGGSSPRRIDYGVIPAVVYTIPEVVAVGEVPDADTGAVTSFKVPFSANLRARIEAYEEGFVKIWVRAGRVVAAQAVGYYVSELMQELANMVALETPIHDVADIIHAHPTYSEITRSVLEFSLGKATDFIMPSAR